MWKALDKLSAFYAAELPSNSLENYEKAVQTFRSSARLFSAAGMFTEVGAVAFWFYEIDGTILIDLNSHLPHALILFSYVMVYLASIEKHFWYVRGWTRVYLEEAERHLAGQPRFLELFAWAKEKALSLQDKYI